MLGREPFARGLQLINSVLSKNSQIELKTTIDSYYLLLQDLPSGYFLEGVHALMKDWKNPHFKPGPGEIREAVENIIYQGLEKEEIVLLAKAYKETKKPLKNQNLNNLIQSLDLNKIESNVIEFLPNLNQKKLN